MEALPGLRSFVLAVAIAFPQQSTPAPAGLPQVPVVASVGDTVFAESFAELQKLGDDGKWSEVRSGLLELLDRTGDQPFVRARRTEIVDELRRAAVRIAIPQPDPAKLIEGKLLAWDRGTGNLSVSYGPSQRGDFRREGDFWRHPAVFDGPVTIKLGGDDCQFDATHPLSVAVGVHDDESIQVAIAGRKPISAASYFEAVCVIFHVVGTKREELTKVKRGPTFGKMFDLEIVVGTTEVAVDCNSGRLGSATFERPIHGSFAVTDTPGIKRLSARGRATPSWLQGRLDAATHDAEAAFLEKWKIEENVPTWLRDGAARSSGPAAAGAKETTAARRAQLPWLLTPEQAKLFEVLRSDLEGGHPEQTLVRLRNLEPGDLPRDLFDYVMLMSLDRLGDLSSAAERLEGFCARNPDFIQGRFLHAKLQLEREALDDALRECTAIQGKFADAGALASCLVQVHLLRGRPEEAQRALREARAAGATSPDFAELDRTVTQVLRGPNFTTRFEEKSPHFTLVTDVDAKTAQASLKILEESYSICAKVFGASDAPVRAFPVYLFSGQASYTDYAGPKSKLSHNTAGMYSALYKMLMVWNQPERGDTAKALRHEATHQYLDLLGYRVPLWFDEGLAVYVQLIASSRKSDLKGGAIDRVLLDHLFDPNAGLIALKSFLTIGRNDFYERAAITYPEAWALVHFLRHGTAPSSPTKEDPAPQDVNARLMAGLEQRLAPDDVVSKAFEGVDLDRFQVRFFDHVKEMRAQVEKK